MREDIAVDMRAPPFRVVVFTIAQHYETDVEDEAKCQYVVRTSVHLL